MLIIKLYYKIDRMYWIKMIKELDKFKRNLINELNE